MDATRFDSHMFHKILKKSEFTTGIIITFQVMAVSRMSPGYPNAVGPLSKGGQEKLGAHSAGAWNPYDPNVGRIFHPADTCQVRGAIAAPIAQKTDDFRFPIRHYGFLLLLELADQRSTFKSSIFDIF
jgi:hypothetical protein